MNITNTHHLAAFDLKFWQPEITTLSITVFSNYVHDCYKPLDAAECTATVIPAQDLNYSTSQNNELKCLQTKLTE